jgi:hypothetical protein
MEEEILIKRTDDFFEKAYILSDFIVEIDLNAAQNNKLIELITKQIDQVEKDSFLQGVDLGIKYMKESEKVDREISKYIRDIKRLVI